VPLIPAGFRVRSVSRAERWLRSSGHHGTSDYSPTVFVALGGRRFLFETVSIWTDLQRACLEENASLYADYHGRVISIVADCLQLIPDSSDLLATTSIRQGTLMSWNIRSSGGNADYHEFDSHPRVNMLIVRQLRRIYLTKLWRIITKVKKKPWTLELVAEWIGCRAKQTSMGPLHVSVEASDWPSALARIRCRSAHP